MSYEPDGMGLLVLCVQCHEEVEAGEFLKDGPTCYGCQRNEVKI